MKDGADATTLGCLINRRVEYGTVLAHASGWCQSHGNPTDCPLQSAKSGKSQKLSARTFDTDSTVIDVMGE